MLFSSRPRLALGVAIAWLVCGLLFINYSVKSDRSVSQRYFHNLGLELSGHVIGIDIAPWEHGRGVLHVSVSAAIPSQVEPHNRESFYSFYYCVLRHNHADLLEGGLSEVQLGDSLQVSCARDSIYYYRHGKLANAKQLFVYTSIPESIASCLDLR